MKFRDQDIPVVGSRLTRDDRIGTLKARWGMNRMDYKIDPGLYALGDPAAESDVLVTANYKLSFDRLRSALPGVNAWILVLNTDGINVWCAAGKRTFGTAELIRKIDESGLSDVVSHRKLILPQLGAPGIAAHEVKKQTGFKVVYGPIRSTDLPEFLESGYQATRQMRTKDFPLSERLALIPMELIPALRYMAMILPVIFILSGFFGSGTFLENAAANSLFGIIMLAGGLAAGTVITPAALPLLPGRAFSFKATAAGLMVSLIISGAFALYSPNTLRTGYVLSTGLLSCALSSFLGMNFTGASTYTSLSGVKKEMKRAVPLQILAAASGLLLWMGSLYLTNVS